jgi:hypothetical protein
LACTISTDSIADAGGGEGGVYSIAKCIWINGHKKHK